MKKINNRAITKAEREIIKRYKKELDAIKKDIAELYEKYSDEDGKLSESEMLKYNRLRTLDENIQKKINELYGDNNKEIAKTLRDSFRESSKATVYTVERATGTSLKAISKARDVNKTVNERMAGLNWAERQGKHRKDLIYEIQKEVKAGISQGDTYKTMAQRLSKSMNISINKANTIVRTETTRVTATAQKETLDKIRSENVVMMKTWNTVEDERVRGENPKDVMNHKDMNGVTIPYDDDFELPDGTTGFGPKMTNSTNDINCRCFLTIDFVVDDKPVEE